MPRPVKKNVQMFTRDTTNESIKEKLDDIRAEYPNIMSVDIKWNADNCTLFVQYIEVVDSGTGDEYYDY